MRRAWPAFFVTALACASGQRFSPQLPPELPDISRWERSSGSYEFGAPACTLEYELYVAPPRPNVYSVTRYRVTLKGATEPAHEKLQWDRNGSDVRRYDCVPGSRARATPCRWKELSRGSAEYDGELGPLLSVYNTHSASLHRRDQKARR